MTDSIKPIGQQHIEIQAGTKDGRASEDFGQMLKESIDRVNSLQKEAESAIKGLAKGELKNVHDAMIAIEKANVSFNLMLQVRNKLVQAYEEIMRMQI